MSKVALAFWVFILPRRFKSLGVNWNLFLVVGVDPDEVVVAACVGRVLATDVVGVEETITDCSFVASWTWTAKLGVIFVSALWDSP